MSARPVFIITPNLMAADFYTRLCQSESFFAIAKIKLLVTSDY